MRRDGISLNALAGILGAGPPESGKEVTVVEVGHDSRSTRAGSLFVAIVGANHDGHDVAGEAITAGAVALLVERRLDVEVPQIVVADTRAALPLAAAEVYGHPADDLSLIGVTGTNGKTTVTHMLESITQAAGKTSGIVGTLGARIAGAPVPLERTTPEASTMQRLLADMVDAGVDVAAVEVSSHAMALGRVDAIEFDVAAFTNLSQDHLDFHRDMEDYYAAKAGLFDPSRSASAVIFVDDPWGERLASETPLSVTTVGWSNRCDVWAGKTDMAVDATSFDLHTGSGSVRVRMALPGKVNVANALVAAGSAQGVGIEAAAISNGLGDLAPVAGRFEVVPGPIAATVIVDYAHSPDAIAAVIADMRGLTSGRLIVVVGAAGDRDPGKRPLMGEAASTADVAVITSDNPRSEDPKRILEEVLAGIDATAGSTVLVEVDRGAAIRQAISMAAGHDAVLILGKGHEQGQEFAGGRIEPFDDRLVAHEAMIGAGAS